MLTAVQYLKDIRFLPDGLDKATAPKAVAVCGQALDDDDFVGGGDRVRYAIPVAEARGPFRLEEELWYQSIGFRWANNLKAYGKAEEPRRFTTYYDEMA